MLGDADDLYNLRSRFYVGDHGGALREARSLNHLTGELRQQRDCLALRCLFAQGNYSEIIDRVDEDDPVVNQLLKIHANTKLGNKLDSDALKEHCDSNLSTLARVVACSVFLDLRNNRKAFEMLANASSTSNLELLISKVQLLLALNRPELASKELDNMKEIDDEHPLSVLAHVWCLLRNGRESEEAEYLLDGLTSKFETTPLLANLKIVAQMQSGNYSEAYDQIKECQQMLQEADNVDKEQLRITITNEITCLLHMGRVADVEDRMGVLVKNFPDSDFVRQHEELSKKFDKFSRNYKK